MQEFQRRTFPSFNRWLANNAQRLADVSQKIPYQTYINFSDFERSVIVLEDHRFLRHHGVDWRSVVRVVLQQCFGRRVGGASTIEMQFVRTITNDRDKTFSRKNREALTAWLLNFHHDKSSILRGYLKSAFFGSGLIGSERASQAIFGKMTTELDLGEAAFLASMLVHPAPLDRNANWKKRVQTRAKYGEKLLVMYSKKYLE